MLKSKFLAVVIISAFAGSFAAHATDVVVEDQAVTITSMANLKSVRGSTITLANGVVWNIDSANIYAGNKKISKDDLDDKDIMKRSLTKCELWGTRVSGGANTVTTLKCSWS